jgi:hypothetical protein
LSKFIDKIILDVDLYFIYILGQTLHRFTFLNP